MAKHGVLKTRLTESLNLLYRSKEFPDEKTEFTLAFYPFTKDFCYISIQKFKGTEFLKISPVFVLSKKIRESFKKLSPQELQAITDQFQDMYLKHKREFNYGEDFESIQSMTFLLTHNISMQRVLDTLYDDTMLFRETVSFLAQIDESIDSSPVDNTTNMFR